MRNILLELAFVGTAYAGWQRQKNGTAIQQVIEDAILDLTGEKVRLIGCGRTDAGVHAEKYFANFRTRSSLPTDRFKPAIQSKINDDIMVVRSREVDARFDARRSAFEKTYRYQIYLGKSPFMNDRWWQYTGQIDYDSFPRTAELVVGDHDFSGFCVRRSLKAYNHCIISQARWRRQGRKLTFKITGNRFLHKMVRFLVGAQLEVASGKLSITDFGNIILHPSEFRAVYPAPPDGLHLIHVSYRKSEV